MSGLPSGHKIVCAVGALGLFCHELFVVLFHGTILDIPSAGTDLYFKYEFVLHTPATAAWLTQTNKGDMVLPDSKWSCGPPAYQFLS